MSADSSLPTPGAALRAEKELFTAGWNAGFQEALQPDRYPHRDRCTDAWNDLLADRAALPAPEGRHPEEQVDWHRRYQDESMIVDNVWAALGISTYEQAQGKDIATLVSELRTEVLHLRQLAEGRQKPEEQWRGDAAPGDIEECADQLASVRAARLET